MNHRRLPAADGQPPAYYPRDGEKDPIPIDRERPFDKSDYPHQPREYHMQPHFRQQMKDPERMLSGEVIARTIACGKLRDNHDGCAAFNWTRPGDGVEWWFLAGFHVDGYRIAVTAWPYLRDRGRALSNGRWTREQLDTIEAFNQKSRNYKSLAQEWPDYIEWSKNHPDGGTPQSISV